eukprot:CAMPEP_0119024024 /NCGR_PEP_ID=MMETSP1176-20130426/31113_1 /TAXON_ID=265551 /ORGANISM="Synedropsis recta cf, Strain CCMP1620" /LENGTH=43 /DNA_ID= /DNA_START= /DNA_END= /DNA_ORIENTATION=
MVVQSIMLVVVDDVADSCSAEDHDDVAKMLRFCIFRRDSFQFL